jgi:hypothetical protein
MHRAALIMRDDQPTLMRGERIESFMSRYLLTDFDCALRSALRVGRSLQRQDSL